MISINHTVGVCGAGAMGAGIAQIAAQAGHSVIVLDRDEAALERGRASINKGIKALLKRGKLSEADAEAMAARIQWTLDPGGLASAKLVIEAIIEKTEPKQDLFRQLEQVVARDAILATNTSSLSVTQLATCLDHGNRFLGLHFFNPAPIMKLVEVVPGLDTEPDITSSCLSLMEEWGKVAVKARDLPGFIVNRVARPFYGEGWRAHEEGACDAPTLDFLFRELAGFRMGPLELGDLIGHDINSEAARSVFQAYFGRTRFRPSLMQGQLAASGRLGRKTGRGVYDHREGAEKPTAILETPEKHSAPIHIAQTAPRWQHLFDVCGVDAQTDPALPENHISVDGVLMSMSDGRTARAKASESKTSFAVFDWFDPVRIQTANKTSSGTLAFAASDEAARHAASALSGVLGVRTVILKDRPGLVVLRTLAQLANCAADAVCDQVGDAASIDKAMRFGVNYPFGPLAWVDEFGRDHVHAILSSIAAETGDPLYAPGEVLLG